MAQRLKCLPAMQETWVRSPGEVNGNTLQYSCLENFEHYFASINTMKRQKDMTLKDELPRLVDAQCVTGGKQRNSSQRCEEAKPKKNQRPVMDVSGGGSKVRSCK